MINLPPEFMAELAARSTTWSASSRPTTTSWEPIDGLDVLAGNDGIFLRCLEVGGSRRHPRQLPPGRPRDARALRRRDLGGADRAREIHASLAPIYDATVVTANPIPVKTALQMLGVVEDNMRLPMVPASEDERAAVRAALEKHGLLVAGGAG